MCREFLERRVSAQHDSHLGNRLGGITLDQSHRWYGAGDHASRRNHGAFPYRHIGQDHHPWSENRTLPNNHALRLTEMSDDRDPNAHNGIVLNFNQVRIGGLNDRVVTDPDTFSNLDPTPAMQPDTRTIR